MRYSTEVTNDVVTISLEGDLTNVYNEWKLLEIVDDYIQQGLLLCVVDLSRVRFMNSSGLGLLTTLLTKFRKKGGELVVFRPSESLKKLLIITKLAAIFGIADDPAEAITLLKSE